MRAGWLLLLAAAGCRAQGVWEARAPYPIEDTEVSAAAISRKVYAVCGITPHGSTNALFIYEPFTDTWAAGAPAPIAGGADHCNVAASGGKLYLLGANGTDHGFAYDPAAGTWEDLGAMPRARGASGVAAIGTKVYLAGGLAGGQSVAWLDAFDTETRTWTPLPDMPTARDHLTAQAVGGKLYAIGGRAGANLAANEEYDPETNAWRARAPLPTARGGIGSGNIGGRIQVFGGEGPSGRVEGTYAQNEEYDPATDTWRTLASMPTPRHGLYGATLSGRVFAPSGGPIAGANFSTAHEAFYLPPAQPLRLDAVVNAASFAPALAPGALATIFGDQLSRGEQLATRLPLATRMNAVAVSVNGRPAPLLYVGVSQVNFQVPPDMPPGPATVTVNNAGAESPPLSLTLAETAPGIFVVVRRADAVEIYCTGLGSAAPAVGIGGAAAEVLSVASAGPGVVQVNARIPANVASGAAVTLAAGGRTSNAVPLPGG